VSGADIVSEAVIGDRKIKRAFFAELDRFCRPGMILACNTTFLNPFRRENRPGI
jgi:3-hydroxyacyl-CoA dehydrogenase